MEYTDFPNIQLFSSESDLEFSLEPALIYANANNLEMLDAFAEMVLSTQTKNLYNKKSTLEDRREFLIDWFRSIKGNGKGTRKVDSAIKLFDGSLEFEYPAFLDEVFNFD